MSVRRCHKEVELVGRVERAFGRSVHPVQCHIVDPPGMKNVMKDAGWRSNEMEGVVGFQVGNNIYVMDSTPWTVLHELIHRAGVNADRLNRFVAEGLTEAIAGDLKKSPDEHQPTYPEETAWVRNILLPKLGLSAIDLGREIAKTDDPPRRLTEMLLARDPGLDRAQLLDDLKPQRPTAPDLGRVLVGGACSASRGSIARRCRSGRCPKLLRGSGYAGGPAADLDRWTEPVAVTLLVAGTILMLPAAVSRWGPS